MCVSLLVAGIATIAAGIAVQKREENKSKDTGIKEGYNRASSMYKVKYRDLWEENRKVKAHYTKSDEKKEKMIASYREKAIQAAGDGRKGEKGMTLEELDAELDELDSRHSRLNGEIEKIHRNADKIADECRRVADVAHNSARILGELDSQFEKKTRLDAADISLLFLGVALQVARQFLTRFKSIEQRPGDKEAAQKIKNGKLHRKIFGDGEEHSRRSHQYYKPSLDEIMTNPVPFDANVYSNGALAGVKNHRYATLGHDPVLGLVFGTANIATSTLTNNGLQSYHIYTDHLNLHKDIFVARANTGYVLWYAKDKALNQGRNGKKIMIYSLLKEIFHLATDASSKVSLPLPGFAIADAGKLASELSDYGLDMANLAIVGKQVGLSVLINWLISVLHNLLYYFGEKDKNETSMKLHKVKTHKILMYSNAIASGANLAAVGITGDLKLLDIGGLLVSLHRIVTDIQFIGDVKRQFLTGEFDKLIMGDPLELEDVDI